MEEEVFGRFTCRIHAYRGRSYLHVFFRIFNDKDIPAQLVEEFLLRLQTALNGAEAVLGDQRLVTDATETGRLLVRQHAYDGYEIVEGNDQRRTKGTYWQGPIALQGDGAGVAGQVRHFAQQYPKRMWAGQVVFGLFTRTRDNEHSRRFVRSRGKTPMWQPALPAATFGLASSTSLCTSSSTAVPTRGAGTWKATSSHGCAPKVTAISWEEKSPVYR